MYRMNNFLLFLPKLAHFCSLSSSNFHGSERRFIYDNYSQTKQYVNNSSSWSVLVLRFSCRVVRAEQSFLCEDKCTRLGNCFRKVSFEITITTKPKIRAEYKGEVISLITRKRHFLLWNTELQLGVIDVAPPPKTQNRHFY